MSPFLAIAFIHLLAVMSPGPDFAIIVQHSLTQPRGVVRCTSLGIALGVLLHVGYSILGIGLLISRSILLFNAIKLLGAGYLVYIGWKAMVSRPLEGPGAAANATRISLTRFAALRVGFLCNALNPKVTLFFLALFTQVIDPLTPLSMQVAYGLWMSVQTYLWFSMLGSILSLSIIRRHMQRVQHCVERIMGAILIALGIRITLGIRSS